MTQSEPKPAPIVELRQYTLHAGGREILIPLFEREFLETQAEVGIDVLGQFHDLDDANRFVWMRSFPDMEHRARALGAFYGGPAWAAGREAANATMIDSDNVLLLRPLSGAYGFDLSATSPEPGLIVVEIHYLDPASLPDFARFFSVEMRPRMIEAGASPRATLISDGSPNSFPRLPVRERETVLVSVLAFPSLAAHEAYRAALAAGPDWRAKAPEALLPQFMRKPEVLRLRPTPRSRLRG
jgi:hypothetical protein